ncbi:MAG TPA: FAD-binding protein [Baekduia sp.]|uniref:FAD-binding protein n=1 Tax=Baekduia sp. TaxID=2600305 RepID=UPI002D796D65|nr:FAD-binding protein [Baekduia sp.]HET6507581.1 FAD-binding protein [Baekduia sp.]
MTQILPDLDGRLALPGDAAYDDARRGWNLAVDQRPAAVAHAASAVDVQAVVRHARAVDLRVAPQATGHGSEALDLDALRGAILLKTAGLDAIAIDPAARTATVGAGVTAGALAEAAAAHGLAPVLGVAPSVGVAGLVLGGGLGWLSRTHGRAASGLLAAEVVTADGERRAADDDLLLALRGGGGRGVIATSLTLALHPVDELFGGMVAWPGEHAAEVLEQVRRVALDAPECLSLIFRVLSLPPLDVIPAPIRGRRIAAVVAVHAGPRADAEHALAPLRATGGALLDTCGAIGPADLVRVAGDPEQPVPARGEGLLLRELTPATVGAIAAVADDHREALTVLEVRQLGGALARDGLTAPFQVFVGGAGDSPEATAATLAAAADVRARLARWTAPRVPLASCGVGADVARGYADGAWERLAAIRDAVDPDRRFLSQHDE